MKVVSNKSPAEALKKAAAEKSKLDAAAKLEAAKLQDAEKAPVDEQTKAASRQKVSGEGAVARASFDAKLGATSASGAVAEVTKGVAAGLGLSAAAGVAGQMAGAGAKADLPDEPEPTTNEPGPYETNEPTSAPHPDTYSKLQKDAMTRLFEEGDVDLGGGEFLPEHMRKLPDGSRLPENSTVISISQGNSAEVNVIKTPEGEFYKQMAGGPPVKMTKDDLEKMKKTFERHHPDKVDDPMKNDAFYKGMWNELFPDRAVEMEGG